jgi:hypothetical protein
LTGPGDTKKARINFLNIKDHSGRQVAPAMRRYTREELEAEFLY